ncbi:hypothetical protein TNCV_4109991 [Trichonephila clavipes]|nr:hypothetical protein TNCV_4109991 [Trichonephila clavipes]
MDLPASNSCAIGSRPDATQDPFGTGADPLENNLKHSEKVRSILPLTTAPRTSRILSNTDPSLTQGTEISTVMECLTVKLLESHWRRHFEPGSSEEDAGSLLSAPPTGGLLSLDIFNLHRPLLQGQRYCGHEE